MKKYRSFVAGLVLAIVLLWLADCVPAPTPTQQVSSTKGIATLGTSVSKTTLSSTPASTVPTKGVPPSATVAPPSITPLPPSASATVVAATDTAQPSDSATPSSATDTPLPASATSSIPTDTPQAVYTPWPGAPLCLDSGEFHNTSLWHGAWNASAGCHYDHEHGDNAFTPAVAAHFPGFDFQVLQGGVQVGHVNQSSPRENAWDGKHGGEKLQVDLDVPCVSFESSVNCVTDSLIQYHWFGNMSIEMESRVHSVVAQERACVISNPSDCGTMFAIQFIDLGQRVFQYQGALADYSAAAGCGTTVPSCQPNPVPAYAVGLLSYFTGDRIGSCVGCRASLAYIRGANPTGHALNVNGVWTSKGDDEIGSGSTVVQFLARSRDMYQVKLDSDQVYPFTFQYVCSTTDPLVYVPTACRYTNTTTRIHEISGVIPDAWDGLDGVIDHHVNGIGFLTAFGQLSPVCLPGHGECFPFKFDHMPTGKYGAALPGSKVSNPTPVSNPSRNVWFCGQIACDESAPGAVPSGWINAGN